MKKIGSFIAGLLISYIGLLIIAVVIAVATGAISFK